MLDKKGTFWSLGLGGGDVEGGGGVAMSPFAVDPPSGRSWVGVAP